MHNEEDPSWGRYAAECLRNIGRMYRKGDAGMTKKEGFTIALPEGKNLGQPTLDVLREAGIILKRRHSRAIEAAVEGMSGVTRAIFCRPEQVADLVGNGVALFGITGKDVILENPRTSVEICAELPYSRQTAGGTRCMLFTYADNPVNTLEDLRAFGIFGTHGGVAEVKREHLVASDYPAETKAFLNAHRINFRVVSCRGGSSEVLVYERVCHYGVALVETGETLAVNGLKEVEGGKIFDSCAVLIGNANELGRNLDDAETESRRSLQVLLAGLLKDTLEARRPRVK